MRACVGRPVWVPVSVPVCPRESSLRAIPTFKQNHTPADWYPFHFPLQQRRTRRKKLTIGKGWEAVDRREVGVVACYLGYDTRRSPWRQRPAAWRGRRRGGNDSPCPASRPGVVPPCPSYQASIAERLNTAYTRN